MFKSIIIPVDVTDLDLARLAVRSAVHLADRSGATVTLAHIVPIMPLMMLDTVPVSFEDEVAEKAGVTLSDLARAIDMPAGKIMSVVRIGGIYHEVLAIAEEQRADLIVVGSHQPSFATYLLGSNACAIVRHATCSVMVVREDKRLASEIGVATGHAAKFSSVDEAMISARDTSNLH